jgi:ParB family transcriptional regulator, chromosome partitioning protein
MAKLPVRKSAFAAAVKASGADAIFGISKDFPHVVEIDVAKIRRNPAQPRKHFDEEELRGLADSIDRHGLKQPILVKDVGGGQYQLIAGERRLRAHEMLGRETIFGILTTGDEAEIAIVENVQRADLDALELAEALAALMQKHGYTQQELAKFIGRSQATVSITLSLNELPSDIKEEYATAYRYLSKSALIELAAMKDPAEQRALWTRMKEGRATVRAVRQARDGAATEASDDAQRPVPARRLFSHVRRAARDLAAWQAEKPKLDKEQRDELLSLRRVIDELLG